MSSIRKATDSVDVNDKVMHYLQNSTRYSPNNSLLILDKSNNLFSFHHRLRSCSENDSLLSSSSSAIDSLSRSDVSIESSLSDPIAHCSITSSSNILSHEELDFNLGFDDISDEDDHHILNKNNTGILNFVYYLNFLFLS
jgi:excinuclease UvrABC ATPase subunit